MPFAVSCPNCTAKLRSANPMKVGNKITCPKCQFDFRVEPGDSVEEVATAGAKPSAQFDFDEPAPVPAKKAPRPAPVAASVAAPAKAKSRPPVEEPKEKPVRAARRPAPVEDEEEEEEDEVERPVKKKKKAKASGIIFIVSLLLVVVILAGGIIYVFMNFASAPADKDLLVYAPADTQSMMGMAVEEMSSNEKIMTFAKNQLAKEKPGATKTMADAKIGMEDVTKFLSMTGGSQTGEVTAIKLRVGKTIDNATLLKIPGATEGKAGSKSYARLSGNFATCVNARTMIVTDKEESMKALLTREAQTIQIGEDMKILAAKAGRSGQFYYAKTGTDSPFAGMAVPGTTAAGVRGLIAYASAGMEDVDLGMGFLFSDNLTAQASMKKTDKEFENMRAQLEQNSNHLNALMGHALATFFKEVLAKVQTTSDGQMIIVKSYVPMKAVEPMMNQLGNPGGMGGMMPQAGPRPGGPGGPGGPTPVQGGPASTPAPGGRPQPGPGVMPGPGGGVVLPGGR